MTSSIKFSRAIELQQLFAMVSVIRVYCFTFKAVKTSVM